jgi:hypothetical protein
MYVQVMTQTTAQILGEFEQRSEKGCLRVRAIVEAVPNPSFWK